MEQRLDQRFPCAFLSPEETAKWITTTSKPMMAQNRTLVPSKWGTIMRADEIGHISMIYEGWTINNRPNGLGTLTSIGSGTVYKGEFDDGIPNGIGVELSLGTTDTKRGYWINGALSEGAEYHNVTQTATVIAGVKALLKRDP